MSNTVCSVIPFDKIGCLNIKIVSGFRKEIPFSFNYIVDEVPEPVDLSIFSDIKFNVFTDGNVLIPGLSKSLGNGIELVDDFNLKVTFLKETDKINSVYYWNLELVPNQIDPPLCFIQGNLEIKPKRNFVGK
jgi:hypothetical protein